MLLLPPPPPTTTTTTEREKGRGRWRASSQKDRQASRQTDRQIDQQRDRYPPVVKHTTQTRGSSSSRSRRIIEYPLKIKSMTEDAQKEKSARDYPGKNGQLQNNQ